MVNKKKKKEGISTAQLRNRSGGDKTKASIKQRIGTVGAGKKSLVINKQGGSTVQVFTKHFDARAKLSTNKKAPVRMNKKPPPPKKKLARMLEQNFIKQVQFNLQSKPKTQPTKPSAATLKRKRKAVSALGERETVFTGKSIEITAKNLKTQQVKTTPNKQPAQKKSKFIKQQPTTTTTTHRRQQESSIPTCDLPSIQRNRIPAKVVVSNLHPNVTQSDIEELFSAFGIVSRVSLFGNGTGEVVYGNTDDAFAAYSKYHERNLDGQPMMLKITTADDSPDNTPTRPAPQRRAEQQHYTPAQSKPVVFTVKLLPR